jgi:hypothetical protein
MQACQQAIQRGEAGAAGADFRRETWEVRNDALSGNLKPTAEVIPECYAEARLHVLHQAGAFFVTRAKSNLDAHRIYSSPTN